MMRLLDCLWCALLLGKDLLLAGLSPAPGEDWQGGRRG